MSRTYRHTPPKFAYETDEDGFITEKSLLEASKHYDQYSGWRYSARLRNRKVRRDTNYRTDFDNYNIPKLRTGWWSD